VTIPVAIRRTGLVTAVGLTAPATCAAIRAKIANPTETQFLSAAGEFMLAHEVPLEMPLRGRARLARMASMAIEEAMADVPRSEWSGIPLLLGVAEPERPGREEGLDAELFQEIEALLGVRFADSSGIVAGGRLAVPAALRRARVLLTTSDVSAVLVAVTDSLLTAETLGAYEASGRLLGDTNSDGFMPGEGAGALFIGPAERGSQLLCLGIGRGTERASIDSGEPLRGDGLAAAVNEALLDAGLTLYDMDFRLADVSGEQYYFKEAALMVSRVLRQRKPEFELWHPAESTGEAGALAGAVIAAVADAACRKGYAPGPSAVAHLGNDAGERMALVLGYRAV
jgi:3-oxoacyl-[acyl-carrier-protein] synthase-1